MARSCNIDDRGRRRRRIGGLLLLFLATPATLAGLLAGWPLLVATGILGVLVGAFGIWEARVGWCAVRAAGVRTPW